MSCLPVLTSEIPSLRTVSVPVSRADLPSPRIDALVKDLIETMKKERGVGIAAPQVGVNERVIIVETDDGIKAFVNPEIIERSSRTVDSEEGCLSVPGVYGIVKRARDIVLHASLPDGTEVQTPVKGFPAIIFQHEIDHLDGILFVDRAQTVERL